MSAEPLGPPDMTDKLGSVGIFGVDKLVSETGLKWASVDELFLL